MHKGRWSIEEETLTGGSWGLVVKLYGGLTFEVVFCPWKYGFPLSFWLVHTPQLFWDFLRKFYFKILCSLNLSVRIPSSAFSFSPVSLSFFLLLFLLLFIIFLSSVRPHSLLPQLGPRRKHQNCSTFQRKLPGCLPRHPTSFIKQNPTHYKSMARPLLSAVQQTNRWPGFAPGDGVSSWGSEVRLLNSDTS